MLRYWTFFARTKVKLCVDIKISLRNSVHFVFGGNVTYIIITVNGDMPM